MRAGHIHQTANKGDVGRASSGCHIPRRFWPSQPTANTVEQVCKLIGSAYSDSRLGNPLDPLDDLIYVVLSNKSSPGRVEATFRSLKERYVTWEAVLSGNPEDLYRMLRPLGLGAVKADQITGSLNRIKTDFGTCNLHTLDELEEGMAERYLRSLPGVSLKVAKCVLLFAFDRQVLPVDSHVHRLASRLGWISFRRADQSHTRLEELIPPALRLGFHVGAVEHGRKVCRPTKPKCPSCIIRPYCAFFVNG